MHSPEFSPDKNVKAYGEGPLLVYICGLDGTGELLFKQIPELSRKYRVITYRSRDAGEFTYGELADDVAALIDGEGEERATVLGESFGGTVALMFALRHPSMVERLVIVNSFARYRGRTRLLLARFISSALPFRIIKPFRIGANLLGLYIDGVSKQDRQRFFEIMRTVRQEGYARRLRLIWDLNVTEALKEIRVPTLFIASERDIVVPSIKEGREMSSRIQDSKLIEVKGAGHACLLGERVSLAKILDEWGRESAEC